MPPVPDGVRERRAPSARTNLEFKVGFLRFAASDLSTRWVSEGISINGFRQFGAPHGELIGWIAEYTRSDQLRAKFHLGLCHRNDAGGDSGSGRPGSIPPT